MTAAVLMLLLLLLRSAFFVVGEEYEMESSSCPIPADTQYFTRWLQLLRHFSNVSREIELLKTVTIRRSVKTRKFSRQVNDERALLLRFLRWTLTGAAFTCDSIDDSCLLQRREGQVFRGYHFTMVGEMRLMNIGTLLIDVTNHNIPGDFVETGVWRGGASLYARAVLNLYSQFNRTVVACDSFQGFPKIRGVALNSDGGLSVPPAPLSTVKCLFAMFGLSKHVEFHKGFFEKSMPLLRKKLLAQGRRIAVLRLDGDRYESTLDVLFEVYDLLSVGGYVIVDDWGWKRNLWGAKLACVHFKLILGTFYMERMVNIDNCGAYWQKKRQVSPLPHKSLFLENVTRFKEYGDSLLRKKRLIEGVHF